MSEQPFTFPIINFAAAAQLSDMRYCELLRLVAFHWVQNEHEDGTYLIESKDQYLERLSTKIKILRELMDNAIDAGDIISSKRTATAEMEELRDLQETLYAFGVNQDDFSTVYDIRANLDINIHSFTLWATKKDILVPIEFYRFNQIDLPVNLKQNTVEMPADKMLSDFTEMLIKFVTDIAQRNKPTNEQFEQIFKEHLASVSHHNLIQDSKEKIFRSARECLDNMITKGRPQTSVRDNMVKAAIYLTKENISALSDDNHNLNKNELIKVLASSGIRLAKSDSETVVELFLESLDGEK
ncbi:MAG: hypothetical protein LWW87_06865 [Geobacteraceae bacterium]|nr:hypothetical protein [Geobacteraceae bacterium]